MPPILTARTPCKETTAIDERIKEIVPVGARSIRGRA